MNYQVPFDPFQLVGIASLWDEEGKGSEVDRGSLLDNEERNTGIETDTEVVKEDKAGDIDHATVYTFSLVPF